MRFTRAQIQPQITQATAEIRGVYNRLVWSSWISGLLVGLFLGYLAGLLKMEQIQGWFHAQP